jgi:hypothetical protein
MGPTETGTLTEAGSVRCDSCGYGLSVVSGDTLPPCPGCGGSSYSRAPLFGEAQFDGRPWPIGEDDDSWVQEARNSVPAPGRYVAFCLTDDRVMVIKLREWTRIGRSMAADVRFDDPTVSRRHALIVSTPDGMRVVDDRSLHGVYVNGRRVEWSMLADGDEILVGGHTLRFLDVTQVAEPAGSSSGAPGTHPAG